MSQSHRLTACRALAAISIVYLTCTFAPAQAEPDSEAANNAANGAANSGSSGTSLPAMDEVVVIAHNLTEARNGIQTQTGASIYTINEAAIGAQPGGDNQLLNQVI